MLTNRQTKDRLRNLSNALKFIIPYSTAKRTLTSLLRLTKNMHKNAKYMSKSLFHKKRRNGKNLKFYLRNSKAVCMQSSKFMMNL